MSMRMASFLAGFGGGYLKADRQSKEDERQAKMDKIVTDRADRDAADYKKKTDYETQLSDAGKPQTMQEMMAKPDTMDNRDVGLPENAALPNNGLDSTGQFKVGQQTFDNRDKAQEAVTAGNTPEAINSRQAQVMQANGKPLEAIQMNNAVMDSKLKKLNIEKEEFTAATEKKNATFLELSKSLGAGPAAAKMISQTKISGFDGVQAEHELSEDGKTQNIFSVGADGKKNVLFSAPAGQAGDLQLIQKILTMKPETTVQWFRDDMKQKQDQSNWQQTFDFNKKKDENDTQYKNRVLGFQASQDKRASDLHKIAMEDAKVPTAVKQLAESYRDQIKTSSAALYKSMAEGNYKANDPGVITLGEQQAAAADKYRALLEPYMTASKGKPAAAADPLELDKPAQGAATAAPRGAAAPKTATAPAQTATMQQVAAIPAIAVLQQKEDEEMMLGKRTRYSPEVQAVVNAKAADQAKQESEYLARERARALVPPMR